MTPAARAAADAMEQAIHDRTHNLTDLEYVDVLEELATDCEFKAQTRREEMDASLLE